MIDVSGRRGVVGGLRHFVADEAAEVSLSLFLVDILTQPLLDATKKTENITTAINWEYGLF